jgi:hypothetical protein
MSKSWHVVSVREAFLGSNLGKHLKREQTIAEGFVMSFHYYGA